MKKYKKAFMVWLLIIALLASCTNGPQKGMNIFDASEEIVTINRESGSGTKISFLNFLGLDEALLKEADETIVSDTAMMLSAVESDPYAIGYLSHSALSPGVTAIGIDGVLPNREMIMSGTYPLSRTFYLVTRHEVNALVQDFLNFIPANADIIEGCGYIPTEEGHSYTSAKPEGTLQIAGSSSVYPLMEELVAQYQVVNPNADIEINKTDSSNGIKNVEDEIAHIAMSSRELTEEELASVRQTAVAKDAIAVIVNTNNPLKDTSLQQLTDIYCGTTKTWEETA